MRRWRSGAVAATFLAAVVTGCGSAAHGPSGIHQRIGPQASRGALGQAQSSPPPGPVVSLTFAPQVSAGASTLASTAAIIRRRADALGLPYAVVRAEGPNVVITGPVTEKAQLAGLTVPGVLRFRQVLLEAPSANGTATWQTAAGNQALVTPQVKKLFNGVNCASKNWQQQIGYTPQAWNDPNTQIVSCGSLNGGLYKFALYKALVLGSQVRNASATLQQGSTFWQVLLNFNGAGKKAFGSLTTKIYKQYGKTTSPLDDLAVVLDGKVISFPAINQGPIAGGSAQITGNFIQSRARQLAADLQTGALPVGLHLTVTTSGPTPG